jgi:hypothetical protein
VIGFKGGTRLVWSYCRVQPGGNLRSGLYYGAEGTMECLGNKFHAFQDGGPVEMDGLAGLRAKALSMACYESSVAGRAVKYADVLEGRVDAYQRPIDEYWKISRRGSSRP